MTGMKTQWNIHVDTLLWFTQLENGQTLPFKYETGLAGRSITWRTVLVIKYDLLAQKRLHMGDFGNGLSVKYWNKHVHISHEARLA